MSPIDDELRNLLHSRADVLPASPDPMAGIERRARRMRRNRVAASVAGSALVVAAVAVAVPSLLPDRDDGRSVVATQPPSSAASPSAAALAPAALDPQQPWAYRGDPAVTAGSELVTLRAEWSAKHPGMTLTPLFGQVYEPSARAEIVFVSTSQGADRWGIATSSESGWEFPYDEALPFGTKVLMAALPGDEVPRLLVLAAPSTGDISYAADGTSFTTVQMPYPGVAFHALEGDTANDVVRVLDGDGDLDHPVFQGPAPDAAARTGGPSSAPGTTALAFNQSDPWAYRGAASDGIGDILSADRKAFVTSHGEEYETQHVPLYAAHLSRTTDVAVVLHARLDGNWVSFTAHDDSGTHQVVSGATAGEDIVSAYVPLDDTHGLLIAVVSDQAGSVVLQTGSRAEVGGSRTAGVWDWTPRSDAAARLAAFAKGAAEPYASQPAN